MPSEGINYSELGIPAPTVEKHVTDDVILEALARQKMDKHIWRQIGNEVFCASGHPQHGFNIPTNKLLTGQDKDGAPLFTDVVV
jgi:hypothetical protein